MVPSGRNSSASCPDPRLDHNTERYRLLATPLQNMGNRLLVNYLRFCAHRLFLEIRITRRQETMPFLFSSLFGHVNLANL